MSTMAPKNKNTWDRSGPQGKNRDWNTKNSRSRHDSDRSNSSQRTCGYSASSDTMWDDSEEHFPALGLAPPPKVNVWEERKAKALMIKELEPQSSNDEEAMLQWAIELSRQEAAAEEERRKLYEQNLKIQEEMLKLNPEFLDDTFDENGAASSASEPGIQALDSFGPASEAKDDYRLPSGSGLKKSKAPPANRSPRKTQARLEKIIDCFGGWGLGDKSREPNAMFNFVSSVIQDRSASEQQNRSSRVCGSTETKSAISRDCKPCASVKDRNAKVSTPSPIKENENFLDGKGTFIDLGNEDESSNDPCLDYPSMNNVSNDRNTTVKGNFDISIGLKESFIDSPLSKHPNNQYQSRLPYENQNNPVGISESHITTYEAGNYSIGHSDLQVTAKANSDDQKLSDSVSIVNGENNSLEHEILNLRSNENLSGCSFQKPEHDKLLPPEVHPDLVAKVESSDVFLDDPFFDLNEEGDSESAFISPPKPAPLSASSEFDNAPAKHPKPINAPTDFPLPSDQFPNSVPSFPAQRPFLNSNPSPESPPAHFPHQSEPYPSSIPGFPVQSPFAAQLPFMNPLLANPGFFPGVMNPMMGCAVDPLMARQLFILSNPYIASQFFALERHLQGSVPGIPCMLPQMPASLHPSGAVAHPQVADTLAGSDHPSQEQKLESESHVPCDGQVTKTQSPPGLTTKNLQFHASNNNVNLSLEEDWLDDYLSAESLSVIPPPQPVPTPEPSTTLKLLPDPPQASKVPSFENPNKAGAYQLSPSLQASLPKTEVTGWSDPEDEPLKPSKSYDGWGNGDEPANSHRSQVKMSESGRKPVYRQPMRQPRMSRYQPQ